MNLSWCSSLLWLVGVVAGDGLVTKNTLWSSQYFCDRPGIYYRRGREGRAFRQWSSVQQIFELLDHGRRVGCHLHSLNRNIDPDPNYMRTFSFSLTSSKWARACLENFFSAACLRAGWHWTVTNKMQGINIWQKLGLTHLARDIDLVGASSS